jgi:hypothetical protein
VGLSEGDEAGDIVATVNEDMRGITSKKSTTTSSKKELGTEDTDRKPTMKITRTTIMPTMKREIPQNPRR